MSLAWPLRFQKPMPVLLFLSICLTHVGKDLRHQLLLQCQACLTAVLSTIMVMDSPYKIVSNHK